MAPKVSCGLYGQRRRLRGGLLPKCGVPDDGGSEEVHWMWYAFVAWGQSAPKIWCPSGSSEDGGWRRGFGSGAVSWPQLFAGSALCARYAVLCALHSRCLCCDAGKSTFVVGGAGLCCVVQGPPARCRSAIVSRVSRPAVASPRHEHCGSVRHSPRPGSHGSHSPCGVCRGCHSLSIFHVAAGFSMW